MRHLLTTILLTAAATCSVMAAEPGDTLVRTETYRPATSALTIGVPGFSHITNTYLSPLKYEGWSVSLDAVRLQAMKFNPDRWIMQMQSSLQLDRTENPARNALMWRLDLYLQWGMMARWRLPHDITLAVGPATSVDAGVLYNPRNGNNPVAVEAAWTIDASAMAAWNFRIKRLPVTLVYQTSFPLTGVFFSPDYGQLYYEIYLGNDKGLARFAHPGNYNGWRNLIAVDLHFGSRALRLGYRTHWTASRASHITNNIWTGAFVIGLAGEWMRVDPYRPLSDKARVIHALY